jgi:hypothetical protein
VTFDLTNSLIQERLMTVLRKQSLRLLVLAKSRLVRSKYTTP